MQDISALKGFLLSVCEKGAGTWGGTRGGNGNLFKNFLDALLLPQSPLKGKGLLGGHNTGTAFGLKDGGGGSKGPLAMLAGAIEEGGVPASRLRFPDTSADAVIAFLEGEGLTQEQIDPLILSVSDEAGMIHVGRLLDRLREMGTGDQPEEEAAFEARDVPKIESLLLKIGYGAEDVRRVMAQALTKEGGVSLRRLSAELGLEDGPLSSGGLLKAALESQGVEPGRGESSEILGDPRIRESLRILEGDPALEVQQRVRQEMAALLTQRGFRPQEVKGFLETLSVSHAGDLLRGEEQALPAEGEKGAEREVAHLLRQVVIAPQGETVKSDGTDGRQGISLREMWSGEEKGPAGRFFDAREEAGGERERGVPMRSASTSREVFQPTVAGDGESPGEKLAGKGSAVDGNTGDVKDGAASPIPAQETSGASRDAGSVQGARERSPVPQLLPNVLDKMVFMIRGGEQKGTLHVSPPELGNLELDVVISRGHLQANLHAETPQVKEAIEAGLGQLRQQLTDQGFIVEKLEVSVGTEDRQRREGDMWTAKRGKGKAARPASGGSAELKAQAAQGPGSVHSTVRIDVHV